MKISMMFLAGLALLAAGCAQTPARGGSSGEEMAGYTQSQAASSRGAITLKDYREVLADPGPF